MGANLFTTIGKKVVLVVVWTKEECTASLHVYPNYVGCKETVVPGLWEYYYETQTEDVACFQEARKESILSDLEPCYA